MQTLPNDTIARLTKCEIQPCGDQNLVTNHADDSEVAPPTLECSRPLIHSRSNENVVNDGEGSNWDMEVSNTTVIEESELVRRPPVIEKEMDIFIHDNQIVESCGSKSSTFIDFSKDCPLAAQLKLLVSVSFIG